MFISTEEIRTLFKDSGFKVYDIADVPIKLEELDKSLQLTNEALVHIMQKIGEKMEEMSKTIQEHEAVIDAITHLSANKGVFTQSDILQFAQLTLQRANLAREEPTAPQGDT